MSRRIKHSLVRGKRAVSPVVATLILIVVASASAISFAFLLTNYQKQAENENDNLHNIQNENLQIAYLQTIPLNWTDPDITAMNMSIRNFNTQTSGLAGIEINGNYAAFNSITNLTVSPYSLLTNGLYVLTNTTQIIPAGGAIQLGVNLTAGNYFQPLPRNAPITIELITLSQNIFTFNIQPPVASFNALQVSSTNYLLNASSSFSPDTFIQSYYWRIIGLIPGNPGGTVPMSLLTGVTVQSYPSTPVTNVTLTVVDSYGLVSTANESLPLTVASNASFPITTTNETFGASPDCSASASKDMVDFVCPYLNYLENIRKVLMSPYHPGQTQSYGYYLPTGLTCGGNIEPSPAIGVSGGYNNVCVLTDNNIEGGYALDYFNSNNSVLGNTTSIPQWPSNSAYNNGAFFAFNAQPYYLPIQTPFGCAASCYLDTEIYETVRGELSEPFFGIGACTGPFNPVYYPSSFGGLYDRREGEYGFIGPYASILDTPGVHLGGIGHSCGTEGQVWYVENGGIVESNPYIVAEMPGTPIGSNDNLEELSFYIDEAYMQCIAGAAPCSVWQNAYQNAMNQYPFEAPRQALHFIQVTRATQAWELMNMTGPGGLTPLQMLNIAIQQIFTPSTEMGPMGVGGALGPDGGLYQQWGGAGSSDTPEPNMQAMIAFDPDMPNWFTHQCLAAVQANPASNPLGLC